MLADMEVSMAIHVAAFGEDPERRLEKLRGLISAAFVSRDFSHTLVARSADGAVVRAMYRALQEESAPALARHAAPTLEEPFLHECLVRGGKVIRIREYPAGPARRGEGDGR